MKSFKALSALISYPKPDLIAALPDIRAVLHEEGLLAEAQLAGLDHFLDWMAKADGYELEESYVHLFDRSRALSLNLFEHIHGESRDRGQAMVDLKALYERQGLHMGQGELPDYLPLFLEFLSLLPPDEARAHLRNAAHIVASLHGRLVKRETPYATPFAAIAELAGESAQDAAIMDDDGIEPDDLASLDAAWEEAVVTFGPGEALDGCSSDRLKTRLRAAQRVPSVTA
ncbi:respiratory nitrate reductase subunit [Brucella endophytica]|uniref:Respiratory nitrate reductase subunit n=1 Tax=Brucella endophytica TaxID=1963359 RepID=A0A916S6J5_9HYPH|nr:nitrate reductase molybdenum cofactor assembly chaperone [Brucella endophytica]GGA86695.1 respiratory nitrate reductase subunit [Brucella endophytica]